MADKNQDGIRTNRVSGLSIRCTIDFEARDGLWRFFEVWGGEITYWTHQDDAEWSMLRLVGRPAIVVLDLPISLGKLWAPELANLVVGRWRGLVDCAGEVHVDLSPGQALPVRGVWQPGHAEYDRQRSCHDTRCVLPSRTCCGPSKRLIGSLEIRGSGLGKRWRQDAH